MTLVEWWLKAPGVLGRRVPAVAKAILIPWLFLGILVALIPGMQEMPDGIRFIIGLPAALGILWMAIGVFLSIADRLVGFGSFVRRKMEKTR